jgi:hypothetical protein
MKERTRASASVRLSTCNRRKMFSRCDACVYIGYHWRTSGEVCYRLGERVAGWALKRYFRATDHGEGE